MDERKEKDDLMNCIVVVVDDDDMKLKSSKSLSSSRATVAYAIVRCLKLVHHKKARRMLGLQSH